VVEVNDAAAAFVAATNFLAIKMGLLSLNDLEADRWLGQALSRGGRGIDGEPLTRILRSRDDVVQLAVFEIPRRHETAPPSLPPLFLLLFRDLTGRSGNRSLKDMTDAFDLTAAEIRLCEELVNNRSLQQVADLFQLSLGTIRQRLKVVFQKTGTHRQSELMSLLNRFL
jgi:DNA-binding CsgD family transcriptional regulator